MRRQVVAVVAFALALLAFAATASTGVRGQSRPLDDPDRIISVTGDIDIPRGVTVDGPVATADGDVDIEGTVTDFVIVGEGDVDGQRQGDARRARGPRQRPCVGARRRRRGRVERAA